MKKYTVKVLALLLALAVMLTFTSLTVFAASEADRAGAKELAAGQSDSFTMPSFVGDTWYKFNISTASKVDITLEIQNNEVNSQARVVGVYHDIDGGNQMPAYVCVSGASLADRTQERSFPVGIDGSDNIQSRTGTYYLTAGWFYINVDWRDMNSKDNSSPQVTITIDSIEPISNTSGLTMESARTIDPSNEVIKQSRFEQDDWEIGNFYYTFTLSEAAEVSIEKSVSLAPSKDERVSNYSELWVNSSSDSFTSIWGKVDGEDTQRLHIWEKRDSPLTQTITYTLPKGTYYVVIYNSWAFPGTEYTLSFTMKTGISIPGTMSSFTKANTYTPGHFTDVNENAWYGSSDQGVIAIAYEYGLMQGDGKTFNPTGSMTLAEAIAIAARVHHIFNGGDGVFTQGSVWYQVYVDYAIEKGIINSGTFSDYKKTATRAEMAYIFSRSVPEAEFESQNTVNSLPDVSDSTQYRDAIITLYKAGVLAGGDSIGTFSPGSDITRAEASAVISRVILPSTRFSDNVFG